MVYKAKILRIDKGPVFTITIPSLDVDESIAYAIGPKGSCNYGVSDLVIVSQTNDFTWVILGYVYGQGD